MPDTKVSLATPATALEGDEIFPCAQGGVSVGATAAQMRTFAVTAAPSAHKTSHQDGGTDEISVTGLSGLLADGQTPLAHTHPASDIASGTIATARLGSGTANGSTFLAGDQTYKAAGSGDVVGPAAATDNALVRFDGTTGKLVQDGTITESDAGVLSGATQLNVDNLRLDGNTLSSTDTNGTVTLSPNGTGAVVVPNGATGTTGLRHAGQAVGTGWVGNGAAQQEWHQNGAARVLMSNSFLWLQNEAGLANQAATSTVPVILPKATTDPNSGLGWAGADQPSLIAGGLEVLRASSGVSGVSTGVNHLVPVEANVAVAASPNIVASMESGAVLTNEGVTAENCHTLPTAAAGYRFTFICQDSDGIKISANTGDTIRYGATVSSTAGFIRTATVGNVVTIVSINATEWIVIGIVGTWTIDL